MKPILLAFVAALASPPASAASSPPVVRKTPDLAKDVAAFPRLVGSTKAIASINRALQAADARTLGQVKDCLREAPQYGAWEQGVETPLVGAHFVSFVAHGDYSCGGAHPGFFADALVFDLSAGERVDWKTLLPTDLRGKPGRDAYPDGTPLPPGEIASPALSALFIAQSAKDSPDPDCPAAYAEQPLNFLLWPDAKEKGLSMQTTSLRHAVEGVCGGPVTIRVETLKRLGVDAMLIRDIETGGN